MHIETQPYPGFPTDLQPILSPLEAVSKGISIITENLFETRFKHLQELSKMGASVIIKGNLAIIKGVSKLHGANVQAHDLRGGAGLVLAGLSARGETVVESVQYIERGYEDFDKNLAMLGANIIKE